MPYDPAQHRRRSIRLQGYDYSHGGGYFITICLEDKKSLLFGDVADDGLMHLSDAGQMVTAQWIDLPNRFPFLIIDRFVVMPNHLHGLVFLCPEERQGPQSNRLSGELSTDAEHNVPAAGTPDGSIGRVIQAFKSIATHDYAVGVKQHGWPRFPWRLWQRDYWEHISRSEDDSAEIRMYVVSNPERWAYDRLNPRAIHDPGKPNGRIWMV